MYNKNKDLKYDRKIVVLLPDEKSHKEHSLSKVFFNPSFFLSFVQFVPLIILEKYMTSSFGHVASVQFSDQTVFRGSHGIKFMKSPINFIYQVVYSM